MTGKSPIGLATEGAGQLEGATLVGYDRRRAVNRRTAPRPLSSQIADVQTTVANLTTAVANLPASGDQARTPFHKRLCQGDPAFCRDDAFRFTVSPSERLVIEYVSAVCTPQRLTAGLFLLTVVGGKLAGYVLPLQQPFIPSCGSALQPTCDSSAADTFAQQTRIYADPGTNVQIDRGTFLTNQFTACSVVISGYATTP